MSEAFVRTFLLWCMYAPIVAIGITLIVLVVFSIFSDVKAKRQLDRFEELYKQCVEKHGLVFAQKLYAGCSEPYIGLTKTIQVFEHHCGIKNELSAMLEERKKNE